MFLPLFFSWLLFTITGVWGAKNPKGNLRFIQIRLRTVSMATIQAVRSLSGFALPVRLAVRALISFSLLGVGRFLPLTGSGKRASGRRDFSESVQTQSRLRGLCLGLRPVRYSHDGLSSYTK